MHTAVTAALDAAGISYQIRPHSRSVYTAEEAAHERGVRVEQIVKVMVVRTGEGKLAAVLIPGDRRLRLSEVRRALEDRRARLATPGEIEEATGFTVGAISPVGINALMDVYVDRAISSQDTVAISSGNPDAGIILEVADLIQYVNGTMGDFS